MKFQLAACFILFTSLAQADVGIYRGQQVVKTEGPSARVTQPEKLIQVVDWNTSEVVLIRFGVKKLSKTFTVSEPTPMVVTLVGDGSVRKRVNTVLARASTEVDPDTGVSTVSSLLQTGSNMSKSAMESSQPVYPRLLKMSGFRLDAAPVTPNGMGPSSLVELRGSFHLLTAQTSDSNAAGDGLAESVQRVVAGLVASGFEDKTIYEEVVVEEPTGE